MRKLGHNARKRLLNDKAARRRSLAWQPPREVKAPKLSAPDRNALGRRYAPSWLRAEILARDGFRCRYCRREVTNGKANIDHVVPWPWRLTERTNLVTACRPCNQTK